MLQKLSRNLYEFFGNFQGFFKLKITRKLLILSKNKKNVVHIFLSILLCKNVMKTPRISSKAYGNLFGVS
jgi:hypothetical protein